MQKVPLSMLFYTALLISSDGFSSDDPGRCTQFSSWIGWASADSVCSAKNESGEDVVSMDKAYKKSEMNDSVYREQTLASSSPRLYGDNTSFKPDTFQIVEGLESAAESTSPDSQLNELPVLPGYSNRNSK